MIRQIISVCAALIVSTAAVASDLVSTGRAVATRSGCLSCHGDGMAGRPILSDPTIAILWSSNLSRVAPRYSNRDLERTIRTATRPDGSHLWMMAAPYAHLSDSGHAVADRLHSLAAAGRQ